MKLTKQNVKARCDGHLCRNFATYRLEGMGGLPRWIGGGICLCDDCLQELYEAIGREIVPKSPDNLIKKAVKRREENEGK